jgi:hypothetical protein
MMDVKFDAYSLRARILPVYLTIAPVVLLLAAVLPNGLNLPLGGAAALVFVPLSFFMGQLGADFGKNLEKRLWHEWAGPPTTRFLRHSNPEFNEITRIRIHDKLRALGLHVPSKEEQISDPRAADMHFESCTEELIRRTRNIKRFPLVFHALIEYGFRRNLLGLKRFGLSLTIIALGASGWNIYKAWDVAQKLSPISLVAALITSGLLLSWLTWVNEKTVRLAANRYARFLLEGALNLE